MVELGRPAAAAKWTFAGEVADVATDLVVVGSTNRRALLGGVAATGATGATGPRGFGVTTIHGLRRSPGSDKNCARRRRPLRERPS